MCCRNCHILVFCSWSTTLLKYWENQRCMQVKQSREDSWHPGGSWVRVSSMPSAQNYQQVRGNKCNKSQFYKCFSCHLMSHCCVVHWGHGAIAQQVNTAGFPLTSAQIYVWPGVICSLNTFELYLKNTKASRCLMDPLSLRNWVRDDSYKSFLVRLFYKANLAGRTNCSCIMKTTPTSVFISSSWSYSKDSESPGRIPDFQHGRSLLWVHLVSLSY